MRQETRIEEMMRTIKESDDADRVVIEAKERRNIFEGRTLRVCAYCRVSTDSEEQQSSFELQKEHYEKLAEKHNNWNLLKIYADEGISGTSMKKRDDFNRMIEACRQGQFDLIVTKSVSRFARNLVDCVNLARQLKRQSPPVGIYFETDGLNTLAEDSELKLSILATFAQEESIKKSESMVWSVKERFKNKKLLMPAPYGYYRLRDAAGKYIKYAPLQIVESEAKIVRLVFDAFLAGYSPKSISAFLTAAEVPNKRGSTVWNESAIIYMLSNERYCGCALTWKFFTADIFEHIKRRTVDERDQILYTNVHDAIISIEKFEAAQALLADRKLGFRGGVPVLHVIDDGVFRGYLPINYRWINEDPLPYYSASKTVPESSSVRRIRKSYFSPFDLTGYQVVRGAFVNARGERPVISVNNGKISFNSYCMNKFSGVHSIQLLLHPTERKIAIRPCAENDIYSIRWNKNEDMPAKYKVLNCPHFVQALFTIMQWNPEYHYRINGVWLKNGSNQIIVFNLENALPILTVEEQNEEERTVTHHVPVCPEQWEDDFGQEFYTYSANNLYYAPSGSDWATDQKSRAVPGQVSYELMSPEEVLKSFAALKQEEKLVNG